MRRVLCVKYHAMCDASLYVHYLARGQNGRVYAHFETSLHEKYAANNLFKKSGKRADST